VQQGDASTTFSRTITTATTTSIKACAIAAFRAARIAQASAGGDGVPSIRHLLLGAFRS
jgi:hypothetical protein